MSIEAMKLALEALEEAKLHIWLGDKKGVDANIKCHQTITALRQAIEQAELVQRAEEAFDRSEQYVMKNAQGELERISLVQTNVGIGKQAEQAQPMAWMQEMPLQENEIRSVRMTSVKEVAEEWDQAIPLYTSPPPRPWVGLTDEEKGVLVDTFYGTDIQRLEAIEDKLKEKNT